MARPARRFLFQQPESGHPHRLRSVPSRQSPPPPRTSWASASSRHSRTTCWLICMPRCELHPSAKTNFPRLASTCHLLLACLQSSARNIGISYNLQLIYSSYSADDKLVLDNAGRAVQLLPVMDACMGLQEAKLVEGAPELQCRHHVLAGNTSPSFQISSATPDRGS